MCIPGSDISLRRAFEGARLAAVHVDLQTRFFNEKTMKAYPAVNEFAQEMRRVGVANHWVAYTGFWDVNPYRQFEQDYDARRLGLHRTIQALPDELVFEKNAVGAFDHKRSDLTACLKDRAVDTIMVTGVIHSACVMETIRGALSRNMAAYVVADATDCHPADYNLWRHVILKNMDNPQHAARLHMTTTRAIRAAMVPAAG